MSRLAGFFLGSLLLAQASMAQTNPSIEHGRQLAVAADCTACHTAPGGKPFAGGEVLATPLGGIVASNITASKSAGIGNYSEQQFADALRQGIRADGAHLYPAMPYTAYAKLSDADVADLYAYFQTVTPVDQAAASTKLPFPFNLRVSMAFWNALFLDSKPFQSPAGANAQVAHGAYLAQALEHCDTCHTPRGVLMQPLQNKALGGASLGTWYAPNISADPISGIGSWSQAELVQYLKTGVVPGKAQAAGPMAEAIEHSLSHLSDNDLQALAVWLKTTAPVHGDEQQAADSYGSADDTQASVRGAPLPADAAQWSGPQLYGAWCASCHQARGEGGNGLPSLFHNTALGHANADNLAMAILQGVRDSHGEQVMPAFAQNLSDAQIATLGAYLLKSFGNPAASLDAARVKQLRAGGAPSPLLEASRIGMALALCVVLVLIGCLLLRRRAR